MYKVVSNLRRESLDIYFRISVPFNFYIQDYTNKSTLSQMVQELWIARYKKISRFRLSKKKYF